MPTEEDSKPSSDSHKPRQGWLAKCGFVTLSVRERHGSPEDPNRPVMTVADSPKKRKRALSPLSHRRKTATLADSTPSEAKPSEPKLEELDFNKLEGTKMDLQAQEKLKEAKKAAFAAFDAALGNIKEINAYTSAHADLIRLEDEDAWDRDAKPKPRSRLEDDRVEKRAATIILAIREYERRVTFGNLASEAIPGPETRDMGGQFLTNKDRIDNESLLYKIAKMVPKGALLHLHFNAELHPELLLQQARDVETMYIRSIRPLLTQEDLDLTETVFSILDTKLVEPADLFSPDYPGTATNFKLDEWKYKVWMPWKEFQEKFTDKFGKKHAQQEDVIIYETPKICSEPGRVKLYPAENWLKSKMVLSQEEAYGYTQTVNGVWARFNQATRCFKGLLNYEKVYKWYIGKAIQRMIDENVMYAELRPMLLDKFIPSTDGTRNIDNFSQMQMIIDGVKEKQAELEKEGQLHKFPFGLKIIYCTPRSIPKPLMQKEMKHCIELKIQFPDLICGFDLVGAEDRPNHIGFYRDELIAFRKTCENLNLEIPFLFHAGESLLDTGGSTDPRNSNLYDSVILKAKRIGHGFSLMKHPHLVEKFKKTRTSPGICIELCPISNELLHLCRNIKEHPFPELLAAGIPCTVNSDNPSLFSNSMSHEFYQIMVGAPTMTLYSWKQLARWSLEYSCLPREQQAIGRKYLDESWKKFCKDLVDKYDSFMKGDDLDEDKAGELYPKRIATS